MHMRLQYTRCYAYCTLLDSWTGISKHTSRRAYIYFNQLPVCASVLDGIGGGNKITFCSVVERTSVVVAVVDSRIQIFIKKKPIFMRHACRFTRMIKYTRRDNVLLLLLFFF